MGLKSKKSKFLPGRFDVAPPEINMLAGKDSPFIIREAYKTLRTNLLFSLSTRQNNVIVISSPMESEGKSTNCANLALSMAETHASVLLIDADLRRPTQSKIFGLKNRKGLADVLGGFCSLEQGIQHQVAPCLDVMFSGQLPPSPSELLGSVNMERLLELLKKQYDFIFIDTPPVNVVTDALVVSRFAAGLCFRFRHRNLLMLNTPPISSIEFSNLPILGIFLSSQPIWYPDIGRKRCYSLRSPANTRFQQLQQLSEDAKHDRKMFACCLFPMVIAT
jgi:capsular exopolysaccharide synthesis family protein